MTLISKMKSFLYLIVILLLMSCNSGGSPSTYPPEAVCDLSHLALCITSNDCTRVGGYWHNNNCQIYDGGGCDSTNLQACNSESECVEASGYWWKIDNSCSQYVEPVWCSSETVEGCQTEGECVAVGGFWWVIKSGSDICANYERVFFSTITFPDPYLAECVGKYSGTVYSDELLSIDCYLDNPIADLTGIEQLPELVTIKITNKAIVDLSPLNNLHHLTRLNLASNLIVDVTPISSIYSLEYIFLEGNPNLQNIRELATLDNLKHLGLSGNDLNYLKCSDLDFLQQELGIDVVDRPPICTP